MMKLKWLKKNDNLKNRKDNKFRLSIHQGDNDYFFNYLSTILMTLSIYYCDEYDEIKNFAWNEWSM